MIPHVDPRLPLGERIAALALDLLSPGPLSKTERKAVASHVMACGVAADSQLYTLHTTCGVFARALRYWAGGPIGKPAIGGGLVGEARAWSAPLGMTHRAWLPYHDGAEPEPGDLCFISSQPWQSAKNGHVLTFVRKLPDGRWQTAEGGGGPDGTRCRLGERTVRRRIDHRDIIGWWRMAMVAAVEPPGNTATPEPVPDTVPAPPPEPPAGLTDADRAAIRGAR